jgi:hypothetical protein
VVQVFVNQKVVNLEIFYSFSVIEDAIISFTHEWIFHFNDI